MVSAGLFVAVLLGGYVGHWKWTGINRHTATLWEWLNLLLLPLVVAFLPIWLSRRTRVTERHKRWAPIGTSVFALIVFFGYVVPWAWTGFHNNTVWDWLHLLLLPLLIPLVALPALKPLAMTGVTLRAKSDVPTPEPGQRAKAEAPTPELQPS